MWQNIVTPIAITLGTNALVVFIAKKWVEHKYAKALAEHTAKLTRDNELEIAKFKSLLDARNEIELARPKADLEVTTATQNFRFSHTFERTADAIVKAYQMAVEIWNTVQANAVFGEGSDIVTRKKLIEQVSNKWREFETYHAANKLFLPKSSDEKLRKVTLAVSSYQHKHNMLAHATHPETIDRLGQDIEGMYDEIPKLLEVLRDDFQKLLGFPDETPAKTAAPERAEQKPIGK